jgi:iron(III) transport system permease protein
MAMKARGAGNLASAIVAALLAVFIVMPLGVMLVQSVVVVRPLPLGSLRATTLEALDLMAPAARTDTMARWMAAATPTDRMQATAVALTLNNEAVPWDQQAAFDRQIAAAQQAVAALPPGRRAAVLATIPLAHVMLKRRIVLAFTLRDRLPPALFERLRSGTGRSIGLDQYRQVLTDPQLRAALRNSLELAGTSAVITTLLAAIIAFGVNRGAVPWPNVVRFATLVPLVSPPVMIATAAILMFGRQGLVTHELLDRGLGWIDSYKHNLYGFGGVVVAQVFSHLPAAFIIIDSVMSKVDGRLEEAAAVGGATPWQVFRKVTLSLSMPGIRRALILVFIMAMTDFGNPLVIGRDLPNLAGALYNQIMAFQNTGLAAALAMWMVVPGLIVYAVCEGWDRRVRYATGDAGPRPHLPPVPLAGRIAVTGITIPVLALILALYGTVLAASLVKVWGADFGFTLTHYLGGGQVAGFVSNYDGVSVVWNSLAVAAIAAPAGGLLAMAIAYLVDRVRPVGRHGLAFMALMPAILPGMLFGIGYIIAFNAPFGQARLALTGGRTILVLNLMFGHLYVGVLAARTILQRLDPFIDEAADILGASLVQRFMLVTLPMLRRPAMIGTLYVFVAAMTSLSAVVFLISPGNDLASAAILSLASSAYYGAAAAMSMTILAIVALVMALIWWLDRRRVRLVTSGSQRLTPAIAE